MICFPATPNASGSFVFGSAGLLDSYGWCNRLFFRTLYGTLGIGIWRWELRGFQPPVLPIAMGASVEAMVTCLGALGS